MCSQCVNLISSLVNFVFGWGDAESKAWNDFIKWKEKRVRDNHSLPAWERYVQETPIARKLWNDFHPDHDRQYPYSREDYKEWMSDLFKTQFAQASNADEAFF